MAGGQERVLRRRIRTIEATKKITRSFELIAASQIARAQGRIAGSRPYVRAISEILVETGPRRIHIVGWLARHVEGDPVKCLLGRVQPGAVLPADRDPLPFRTRAFDESHWSHEQLEARGLPRLITGRSQSVVIAPRLVHNLQRYARD